MVSPQSGQNLAVMGDRCPLLHTLFNFWPHVVQTAAVSSATLTWPAGHLSVGGSGTEDYRPLPLCESAMVLLANRDELYPPRR
jgi:hypothetical protein